MYKELNEWNDVQVWLRFKESQCSLHVSNFQFWDKNFKHKTWIENGLQGVWDFAPERKETGSLGATESEVWTGNFNVKPWKFTKHKLHNI